MILTCPQCATRYQADASKFGAGGRMVRCAKCGHVWLHMAAGEAEAAVDRVEDIAAPPGSAVVAESGTAASIRETLRTPMAARGADEPSPWPRRASLTAGWILLIAIVFVVVGLAIRSRETVVAHWPQAASLYAALGVKVDVPGIGFIDVDYRRGSEAGQPVLTVSGKLVNTSLMDLPVPPIHIALTDQDRHELYHQDVPAGIDRMKPGETVPFTASLPSPPAGARHIELRFVPGQ